MGQAPISDIFSGQGADLLYVLVVCQNGVEICLIQLSVSHHEIVDGFTVAVIQITVEFGVFVYNALAADKCLVVRLVIRLAALLEKRLFRVTGSACVDVFCEGFGIDVELYVSEGFLAQALRAKLASKRTVKILGK